MEIKDLLAISEASDEVKAELADIAKKYYECELTIKDLSAETDKMREAQKMLNEEFNNSFIKEQREELKKANEEIEKNIQKISEHTTLQKQYLLALNDITIQVKSQEDAVKSNRITFASFEVELKKMANGYYSAAKAVLEFASKAAIAASQIQAMSQKTKLSVQELQKIQHAAEKAGVSFKTLSSLVSKLQTNMNKAQKGSENMSRAFKSVGVSVDKSTRSLKDMYSVFGKTISGLSGIENESKKNSAAVSLFGKNISDVLPQVIKLADGFENFNSVLSGKQIATLDAYGKKLATFKSQASGGKILGAQSLTASFGSLVKGSSDIIRALSGISKTAGNMEKALKKSTSSTKNMISAISSTKSVSSANSLIEGLNNALSVLEIAQGAAEIAQIGLNVAMSGFPNQLSLQKNNDNGGLKIINYKTSAYSFFYLIDNIDKALLINVPITISISFNGIVESFSTTLTSLQDKIVWYKGYGQEGFQKTTNTTNNKYLINMNIVGTAEETQVIDWVKIEYGSVATPFIPKSYADELRDCQRYFSAMSATGAMPYYN